MVENLGINVYRNYFTNLFWGVVGDKIGWVRQVRWFGCMGMVISLAFYYLPISTGPNIWVAGAVAIVFGFAVAAFVPMSAIFPILEPNHKGQRFLFIIYLLA